MASVTLTDGGARIALLSNLADDLHLPAPRDRRVTGRSRGAVRQYVGGVRRPVTLPGRAETISLTFPRPTWEQTATLLEWNGLAVLYRELTGFLTYALLDSTNDGLDVRTPIDLQQAATLTIALSATTDTPETLL